MEDTESKALAIGADVDPPIIDGYYELLDGFHRVRGYLTTLEDAPEIGDEEIEVLIVGGDVDLASLIADAENPHIQEYAIALARALMESA